MQLSPTVKGGGGAYFNGDPPTRWGPLEVSRDHINVLELRAIFYGFQSFCQKRNLPSLS